MLKIFLVEDEFVVREGIKNIDWASHGYEFCGEASDGEIALPQIAKIKPDIVITDIKMPFMDGLELARHIRKDFPQIEIVILSGYEEFGYAKEAISLGVSKYLTKPISSSELIEEINQLKEIIEERKREREISKHYLNDIKEDTRKARQEFFNELVSGTKSVSETISAADELGINLSAQYYVVVLGIVNSVEHEHTEYSHRVVNIYNAVYDWFDDNNVLYFDRDLEGTAMIFMADSDEALRSQMNVFLEEFKSIINAYEHIKYYLGVGETVSRISELGKSFTTAGKAFAHRYFDAECSVVFSSDRKTAPMASQEDVSISMINPRNFDRTRVVDFLKTGEASELDFFVSEFFDNLGEEAVKSNMFRQYMAMDLYFTTSEFVSNLGLDKDKLEAVDSKLACAENEEAIQKYFYKLISDAFELRDSVSHNKYKDIVDSVIKYIETNYMDEDLSLNTLAEHVRFSPNHLSMIFSQQTGMTLSKYLIEYRISKAKEALKCTSLKSSEIAIEIGYKDPHYFSYMFKKITGMTPTQYREGKND